MKNLAAFLRGLKQSKGLSSNTIVETHGYYKFSLTCQIPKLGDLYEHYFGQKNDGLFVEVGAYDGEYASNTSGLADLGWTGFYIEPVPEYFRRCELRHATNKQITVSQFAIGAERANVKINVGGPLSTTREDVRQNFERLAWAEGHFAGEEIEAEQITLEDYLIESNVKPKFELLVLDIEGSEWQALQNFDVRLWQPQMVIIELHDQNKDYPLLQKECNNIVKYFDEKSYKVVYKDFSNTIYVPKDSYPSFTHS